MGAEAGTAAIGGGNGHLGGGPGGGLGGGGGKAGAALLRSAECWSSAWAASKGLPLR